jgi:hypothetical protein
MGTYLDVIAPEVVHSRVAFEKNSDAPHLQWQVPACTEGYAAKMLLRDCEAGEPSSNKYGDLYFAYPWATVIDRRCIENAIADYISWISNSEVLQKGRRIHTVCQSIHWDRILPVAKAIGITDIHISHCTNRSAGTADEFGINVHSFPLIAACYFNLELKILEIPKVKQLSKRKWLIGFNGNHMSHYRSDIRLKLERQFQYSKPTDSYFQLDRKWFFNDIIYDYQISDKAVPDSLQRELDSKVLNFRSQLEDTVFSLCPEGAGPNTLRFWESLAAGAIPVVFESDWIPPKGKLKIADVALVVPRRYFDSTFDYIRSYWASNMHKLEETRAALRTQIIDSLNLPLDLNPQTVKMADNK